MTGHVPSDRKAVSEEDICAGALDPGVLIVQKRMMRPKYDQQPIELHFRKLIEHRPVVS